MSIIKAVHVVCTKRVYIIASLVYIESSVFKYCTAVVPSTVYFVCRCGKTCVRRMYDDMILGASSQDWDDFEVRCVL